MESRRYRGEMEKSDTKRKTKKERRENRKVDVAILTESIREKKKDK